VTPLDITLTAFVLANPLPETCTTHGAVSVHVEICVSGPLSVKTPTSKRKSVSSVGEEAQHNRYSEPAVPPVISPVAIS
jgi:hypothetical protein